MPRKISELFFELRARTEGLKKDLDESERHLGKFTAFVAANPTASIAAFGAAIVSVGAKALLMAADVDKSMRSIQANLPRGESMKGLTDEISAISQESGRARGEVLGLAQDIARMGAASAQEVAQRAKASAMLGDAIGAVDLHPIAEGLDQVSDLFGITGDQAMEFFAQLASSARGRTDMEGMFAAFVAAAPHVRELGLDAGTTAKALVYLTDSGLSAKKAAAELAKYDAAGVRELAKNAHISADALKELEERAELTRNSLDRAQQRGLNAFNEKMEALGQKILPWVASQLEDVLNLIDKLDGTEATIIATSDIATVKTLGRLYNSGKLQGRSNTGSAEERARTRREDQQRLVNAGNRLIFANGSGEADLRGMSKAELTELRAAFIAVENASRETGQRLSANWKPFLKTLDEAIAKAKDLTAIKEQPKAKPPHVATADEKKAARERSEKLAIDGFADLGNSTRGLSEAITEAMKKLRPESDADIQAESARIAAEITTTLVDDMQLKLVDDLGKMFHDGLPEAIRQSYSRNQGALIVAQGVSERVAPRLEAVDQLSDRASQMRELRALDEELVQGAKDIVALGGNEKENAAALVELHDLALQIEQKRRAVIKDQAAAEQASSAELRERTKKVGQEIHNAASFAYGLAEAFGLANSEIGQLLVSVMQLGEGIANLASGNIMQGTVQTVGALINIGKKLFGGESSEDRRRREQAQNSVAQLIDGIRGEIHGTTSLASRLQGGRQEFANARQQVEEQLAGKKNEAERERRLRELNALEKERLAQLTQEFIVEQQQAKEDYEVRRLRASGHEEEAQALADAEAAQREYADAVAKGADELTLAALAAAQAAEAADRAAQAERRAREKRIERADQENEIFDVTDPKARLAHRASVYQGFGGALGGLFEGLDLTKEADVAKLDERVKELFRTLETAPDSVDLAGMSIDELISVLLGLDSACDDVAAGVQSAADAFNEAVNSLSVDAEIAGSADPTGAAQGIAGAAGASFSEISNALAGIDLSTEEGRKKAESALQELYAAHKDNKPLVDAIRQVLRAIRAVPVATPADPSGGEARGSAGGGGHESLANAAMGLTQAVGSRMADYLASIDIGVKHLPTDIAAALDALLTPVITGPVFPPALPSLPGTTPGRRTMGDGGITVNVQVYLQLVAPDGTDPQVWGDTLGQSIGQQVNKEFVDWYRNAQKRNGNLDRPGVS